MRLPLLVSAGAADEFLGLEDERLAAPELDRAATLLLAQHLVEVAREVPASSASCSWVSGISPSARA